MKITFIIEYFTRWGENLVLRRGDRSFPMAWVSNGIWTTEVDAEEFFGALPKVEYYYEVVQDGLSTRHEWRCHTLEASSVRGAIEDSWSDIPGWKGAGTAIPVFALRSGADFGVGEFLDLEKMVDWMAKTGQTVLQVLPVNDTTMSGEWMDSYPYNANSTFALHPQFINLEAVGIQPDEDLRRELNSLDKIDYVRVNKAKMGYLRQAFEADGGRTLRRKAYKDFLERNRDWLIPYAAFCALRDEYHTADFSKWGEMARYSPALVGCYCEANRREIAFHCFVQYNLDAQLRRVRDYAHSKGVVLKGDLPIGISRTSADAWQFPQLFNMDSQAGAPPDAFSADGQNWGFPTYNWDEMEKDGYAWWKRRLRKMNEYFDAFRIDHLLGFFRIWEIPLPLKSGMDGHFSPALPYSGDELRSRGADFADFLEDPRRKDFWHPRIGAAASLGELHEDFFYRRHNDFWKAGALRKLSALLGATPMLACGEDLGMIPSCVPEVMGRLNILSLEIQRMPKTYGRTFDKPSCYPYGCVCTTSTHDMNPLRAWWEEDRALTQKYYNEILGHTGAAPLELDPATAREILAQHLSSPAMLVIEPLQDYLAMSAELRRPGNPEDERINVPSICPYNWQYRMHLTLEDLLGAEDFNRMLSYMISAGGRSR